MKSAGTAIALLAIAGAGSVEAQQRMDTVKVVAERVNYLSPSLRGFEERRLQGHGRFVGEKELRANEHRGLADILANKVPGLKTIANNHERYLASTRTAGGGSGMGGQPSGRSTSSMGRLGSRNRPVACYVSVYLDGLPMYTGDTDPPNIEELRVDQMAGAEFYAGGASLPAQFSQIRSGDCGVLLLWTRER